MKTLRVTGDTYRRKTVVPTFIQERFLGKFLTNTNKEMVSFRKSVLWRREKYVIVVFTFFLLKLRCNGNTLDCIAYKTETTIKLLMS